MPGPGAAAAWPGPTRARGPYTTRPPARPETDVAGPQSDRWRCCSSAPDQRPLLRPWVYVAGDTVWRGQARPALAPPSGTQVASHSFEYRATWPAAGARARPGHQLAGRKGCVSCRSCVSCMCAGHWPEEYFGLVCPLARTRARGDKPRAGTGHVPPAGVGSRPPPPEPGRVTSPQSPAWTSQRGCPPQLTARAEGGTECGAGPLHACGRPQPVRLRPVGPSRNPCHHQPIPKAWKGRNVKCEIKRPARVPGRAEGPAARGAPLALPRRKPHRGRRSCADVRDVSWGAAGAGRALPGLQLESVGG